MGWLDHFEQQQVLTLYGRRAEYRCDECRQPIFENELPIIDSKKGNYPKDPKAGPYASPRPKVTYHRQCDDIRRGKRPRFRPEVKKEESPKKVVEASGPKVEKIAKKIVEAIANKPRKNYWDVGKIIALFEKPDKGLIRQVVRDMRAHGKLIRKKSHLYLPKKGKR